jgi:hypothetical protein
LVKALAKRGERFVAPTLTWQGRNRCDDTFFEFGGHGVSFRNADTPCRLRMINIIAPD